MERLRAAPTRARARVRARAARVLISSPPQAGVSFLRFAERLSNEFSSEVPGFSFFSTATREEVQVGDEAAFVKCKLEMLAQVENEDDAPLLGGNDGEEEGERTRSLDITVKVLAASLRAGAPAAQRTAEHAAVRREREEARRARLKELERTFDSLQPAKGAGAAASAGVLEPSSYQLKNPIHAAAERGDLQEVERILEKPGAQREKLIDSVDGMQRTALYYAAGRGRLDLVEHLLNKGARVDLYDLSQLTALHRAAAGGHTAICRALALAQCDPNARAQGGVTPMMLAAKARHFDCVQVLLRHGARAAECDDDGRTAAAYAPRDATQLCALLSAHQMHLEDTDHRTTAAGEDLARPQEELPQRSQEQELNVAKNALCLRLRKMTAELECMDLHFAQGRGSGVQVHKLLSAVGSGLQTAEGGVAGLEKLHLQRHTINIL